MRCHTFCPACELDNSRSSARTSCRGLHILLDMKRNPGIQREVIVKNRGSTTETRRLSETESDSAYHHTRKKDSLQRISLLKLFGHPCKNRLSLPSPPPPTALDHGQTPIFAEASLVVHLCKWITLKKMNLCSFTYAKRNNMKRMRTKPDSKAAIANKDRGHLL